MSDKAKETKRKASDLAPGETTALAKRSKNQSSAQPYPFSHVTVKTSFHSVTGLDPNVEPSFGQQFGALVSLQHASINPPISTSDVYLPPSSWKANERDTRGVIQLIESGDFIVSMGTYLSALKLVEQGLTRRFSTEDTKIYLPRWSLSEDAEYVWLQNQRVRVPNEEDGRAELLAVMFNIIVELFPDNVRSAPAIAGAVTGILTKGKPTGFAKLATKLQNSSESLLDTVTKLMSLSDTHSSWANFLGAVLSTLITGTTMDERWVEFHKLSASVTAKASRIAMAESLGLHLPISSVLAESYEFKHSSSEKTTMKLISDVTDDDLIPLGTKPASGQQVNDLLSILPEKVFTTTSMTAPIGKKDKRNQTTVLVGTQSLSERGHLHITGRTYRLIMSLPELDGGVNFTAKPKPQVSTVSFSL